MTVVFPEATPSLGNTKVWAVVAVADQAAPKLATEIGAATTVDLSNYLIPQGWNPTASTAKGTKQRRLGTKAIQEQLNSTTYQMADLMYVYDPQGAAGALANKAKALLTEDTKIYFVERMGLDADVAGATGQLTRVHYCKLGPQIVSADRTDENGEFYIMQSLVYVGSGPVDGTIAA